MTDGIDQDGPRLLVVNDSQEIVDLLQDLLVDEGYQVFSSLAVLNLDRIRELAPALIIQDLLFEGMQEKGWNFLTMIRLDPVLAAVPVILCTAAVTTVKDPTMAAQLERLGVSVVLKPFDLEHLVNVIRTVLGENVLPVASRGHADHHRVGSLPKARQV